MKLLLGNTGVEDIKQGWRKIYLSAVGAFTALVEDGGGLLYQ